jgi:integrase/recombinase XerC
MPEIPLFCDYLLHQKKYSIHTVTAYQKDLTQFKEIIDQDFDIQNIKEVNSSVVRSWIVHLLDIGISTRTINRKISSLKSFYKYLLKNGVVGSDPLLKVVNPKISKRLPEFIGELEMEQLFALENFNTDFEGVRNRLIIELFYGSGIRLSELVGITLDFIDFNNRTLKVVGKRNKERIIPFGDRLNSTFKDYLVLREGFPNKLGVLFLTKKGSPIYDKLVYRVVNAHLGKITTASKKSPHVLRHTFATHMLNNGADLNAIKEILGHANLSATQVYTHNSKDKLKKIHQKNHPKA